MRGSDPCTTRLGRDIKMFLRHIDCEHLGEVMEDLGIASLEELEQDGVIQVIEQHAEVCGFQISDCSLRLFSPEVIDHFKFEMAEYSRGMLSVKMSTGHHFMFLSHYKVEAGTEAALMRAEIEALIDEDEGHPAQDLEAPIFLDSEDLTDLDTLIQAVGRSHNLVLMLTKGLFTRPWCIIEIITAYRENVTIIPVHITKSGCEFVFPDDQFYTDLAEGRILDRSGMAEVEKHGFTMQEAAMAIRRVFKRIAVTYSPHRAGAFRKKELETLLHQCSCREIVGPGEAALMQAASMRRESDAFMLPSRTASETPRISMSSSSPGMSTPSDRRVSGRMSQLGISEEIHVQTPREEA